MPPVTYDCRTCGACCVSTEDTPYGWADVTADDLARMSRRVRLKLVQTGGGWRFNECHFATPTTWRENLGCAPCGFLRGAPGKRCSCGIYETRPDVCRTFRPGSRRCKESRREMGMDAGRMA